MLLRQASVNERMMGMRHEGAERDAWGEGWGELGKR